MYIIKNDIITFSYHGEVRDSATNIILNSIVHQLEKTASKKFKGILISLKDVVYNGDSKIVALMVKRFIVFSKETEIPIAFIDYTLPLYKHLQAFTKKSSIKLYKNASAARVFLNPKSVKEDICILLYDKDESNRQELWNELSRYGYSVVLAKNADNFRELSSENKFDVIVTQTTLNSNLTQKKPTKNLALSKKLVANLPLFMDTAVETLVTFTGLEAKKSAHTIKKFDISVHDDIICTVMRFDGDLEGSFVLLFPKEIAIIAIESLLGEIVESDDMATITDGVGEFCNTITGNAKTALSRKDINVVFHLPKTFTSLQSTLDDIGDNSGIWIDMQLNGKPFFMFITK